MTSAIPVPRTVAGFRAVGWDVIFKSAGYRVVLGTRNLGSFRMTENLSLLDTALHEWLGLLYYRLTNRTQAFLPAPDDLPLEVMTRREGEATLLGPEAQGRQRTCSDDVNSFAEPFLPCGRIQERMQPPALRRETVCKKKPQSLAMC